jgi:hypothetical protein
MLRITTACLALALAGCGGDKPAPTTPEKKTDGGGASSATPALPAVTPLPPSGPADDATTKVASDFLRTVGDGTVTAATMTPAFLKVIGKPLAFETDQAKGYNPDLAEQWVKRVGGGLTFGLPSGTAGGGAAAVSGSYRGPNREGRYLIRLVQEGGWKVDWFQLSSAPASPSPTASGDAVFQQFAAAAFLDVLADKGNKQDDRVPLLANLLSPELRKEWATPFASDTKSGYDYNPGQIALKFAEIGAVDAYTAGAVADLTVKGELTKAAGKKPFTLKLAKGTGPGQWVVSSFAQQ